LGRIRLRPGARSDDDEILGRIDENRLTENSHRFVGAVVVHPPLETVAGLLLPRCLGDPITRKYAGIANLTAAHEEQAEAAIVPQRHGNAATAELLACAIEHPHRIFFHAELRPD